VRTFSATVFAAVLFLLLLPISAEAAPVTCRGQFLSVARYPEDPASHRVFGEFCRPARLDPSKPVQLLLHGATYDHRYWSAYARLAATTEALAAGMADAAGDRPVQIQSVCGLVTIFFSETPVTDYAGAQACDAEAYGAWCRALLANGVYPPPSQFEAWFPSLAHTEEHVERTIEAARAAFAAT